MATIKHTSSKNSDLSAAERYLTFQHNEYTGLPILDEHDQLKLRDAHKAWLDLATAQQNLEALHRAEGCHETMRGGLHELDK